MALSTDSRSASASSVSMVSMSAIGSTLPATCTTSSFSKQRTTWQIASTSRMWARNLLPRPSPLAAPATRPAISTNSTAVGITFCGLMISASAFRRGSGTGTTPTLGSIVQKGKLAAAMPALVNALKRVDLPTFGRPTMPHVMPIVLSGPVGVQPLHGFVEIAGHGQRQHVERVVDGASDENVVVGRRAPQHPSGDAVLVPGVADADAQAVEPAVAEQAHGVAQSVLTAVPAVELEPGGARRKVQLVVDQQRLFRLDLPELQGGEHRLAAEVHEGGRLEQPGLVARDPNPGRLAVQLAVDPEALALAFGQGVDKTEPGI